MPRRAKGLGAASLSGGLNRRDRIDRPLPASVAGRYPKGSDAGVYGTAAFPTVIEQYDRTSDWKRWKLGQAYYYSAGRAWADWQVGSLARFVGGAVDATSKDVVTAFPSGGSPERAWYVGMRTRGSVILPQPITADRVSLLNSDPDPANHRLVLDVSGILSTQQLNTWRVFLGDPFEDTASGPSYPDDLIEKPAGSVQLTLVDVQVASSQLVFDLSRPVTRIRRVGGGSRSERIYQARLDYDPADPVVFDTSGTRHLVSSFKFFCCCPDCLGGALANLEIPSGSGDLGRLPLPNAARTVRSAWERQGAGYYRQWRTLPDRHDERRDCKHIHALRWQCGVPWIEPDDLPTLEERDITELAGQISAIRDVAEALDYFRLRAMNFDRYAMSLADVVGLTLFPPGDVRDAIRPDARPMLWNDGVEPLASWCRQNDWWCERGSRRLKIFNAGAQAFEETVNVGGVNLPFLEEVGINSSGGVWIVP